MPTHVIIQPDPYLAPAVFLVAGLLVLLLASVRGRTANRWRRLLRVGYGVAASFILLLGTGMAFHRAHLFWGVEWNGESETLVLERPLPLGGVALTADEIDAVVEVTNAERRLSGPVAVTRFQVRTDGGHHYWSAPLYRRGDADETRLALLWATKGRLERFQIGSPQLPE